MTKRIAIHKTGEEGIIQCDSKSGVILTPVDQRPDWADGYAMALVDERNDWYTNRLGAHLTEAQRSPELLAADDLGFVGVDVEGDEVEIEASNEYRMEQLAGMLDIDINETEEQAALTGTGNLQFEATETHVGHHTDEVVLDSNTEAEHNVVERRAVDI